MSIDEDRKKAQEVMADLDAPVDDQTPASTPAVETPAVEQKPQETETKPLDISFSETPKEAKNDDSKAAELEAQLQKERVEAGRLRKVNEELTEERRRREELEQEIQQIKSAQRQKSYLDAVPEDLRNTIDEDVIKASGSVTESMIKELRSEIAAEIEALKSKSQQSDKAVMEANVTALHKWVNEEYPGLSGDTAKGGPLNEAWQRFMAQTDPVTGRPFGIVINDAFKGNRQQGVKYVLDSFVNAAGITRRGGAGDTITPSGTATSTGGSEAQSDGKIYTETEYLALFKSAEDLPLDQRQALVKKLQTAAAEGRVVRV